MKDVCTKFAKNNEARKQCFDIILASSGLAEKCTDACHIYNEEFIKLSDHFPVVAQFE